jgi:hypothetical protein
MPIKKKQLLEDMEFKDFLILNFLGPIKINQ